MTQYEAITPDILDELKAISGHRVIVGEEINPDYTHDDMPIYGLAMPEVTIDVTSTEERFSHHESLCPPSYPRHVPRRGNGPARGMHPGPRGRRFVHHAHEQDPWLRRGNMNVRVEAGVLLADLAKDAESRGFFLSARSR